MDCLSIRAGIDVPGTPALPSPAKFPKPGLASVPHAGLLDTVVVGEFVVVGESVGVVGITGDGAAILRVGNTLGTGTAGVELTPRLLISKDPNGVPVRATPPGAVGKFDVGTDDAARLPEPEPHIPDIPDVSSIPEEPELIGISDVTDVADGVDDVDIAVVPEFAAVAGIVVPIPIPPPSKLALEPNISEGGVATVGHAVLVVVVGIVIVPVASVGSGLTPEELISVEPSGSPVGEPAPPIAMPSGEVAPTVGVGVTVPTNCPSTCATAKLPTKSAGRIAAMNKTFTRILHLQQSGPVLGYQTSVYLRPHRVKPGKISSGRCPNCHLALCSTSSALHRFFARLGSLQNVDGNLRLAVERERSSARQRAGELFRVGRPRQRCCLKSECSRGSRWQEGHAWGGSFCYGVSLCRKVDRSLGPFN